MQSSDPKQSMDRLRDHALACLIPFFLTDDSGNEISARESAAELLDVHPATTPRELQLAAHYVALSWASLAVLGAAALARPYSLDAMLDMQDTALALNAESSKCAEQLENVRKQPAKAPDGWEEGTFQLIINRALDRIAAANKRVELLSRAGAAKRKRQTRAEKE